jgi:hypothetical protein
MSEPNTFDAHDAAMAAGHDEARVIWQDLLPPPVLRDVDPNLYELRLNLTAAETLRRWHVAHTWAATDSEAAWAQRNAENHLRRIRPAAMAAYDQRVSRGVGQLDAMRAVTPDLVNASVGADAVMSPAEAAAYLEDRPELAARVAEEARAILERRQAGGADLVTGTTGGTDNESHTGHLRAQYRSPRSLGLLSPAETPPGLNGADTVRWLSANHDHLNRGHQWATAAAGAALAVRIDPVMATQVGRLPGEQLTGMLATAAHGRSAETATAEFYAAWLIGHRHQITAVADALADPSARQPYPFAPLDTVQAKELLERALIVPLENDLHSTGVDIVRTMDIDIRSYRCEHAYDGQLHMGWADWESDRLDGGNDEPADLRGGLGLVLVAPGVVEAITLEVIPDPFGTDDLVVEHAVTALAAGGVSRLSGQFPYNSAWGRQPGWRWDPDEVGHNLEELRLAVLRGSRQWWLTGRGGQHLVDYVDDLHAAVGVTSPVLALRWDGLHEAVPPAEAADRLWRPLLERSVDELAALGPSTIHATCGTCATCGTGYDSECPCPSCVAGHDAPRRGAGPGAADLRVGGWVLEAGELTMRAERYLGEEEGRAARLDLLRRPPHSIEWGPENGPELGPTL